MSYIQNLLFRYRDTSRGSVATMGGLLMGMLATSVIAAIDINDAVISKQKIQHQLDAAVLFAASHPEIKESGARPGIKAAADEFLRSAFEESGLRIKDVKTDFRYDPELERVVGDVSYLPNSFFTGGIIKDKRVAVKAAAMPRETVDVEVSLVLDLSGSMNFSTASDDKAPVGSRRIDALRDGVDALIETLDETPHVNASYTVVPYATSVDVTDFYAAATSKQSDMFKGANGRSLPKVCSQGRKGIVGFLCDVVSYFRGSRASNPSPTGAWGAERFVSKDGDRFTLSLEPPGGTHKVPVVSQPARKTECHDAYVSNFGSRCVEIVTVNGVRYVEHDYFAPRVGPLPRTGKVDDVKRYMKSLKAEGATAGMLALRGGSTP